MAPHKPNGRKKLGTVTPSSVGLRPAPNGHGFLKTGNPGNSGGANLPRVVRDQCLRSFQNRIPIFEAIADNPEEKSETRMNAVDKLGKFGFGSEASTIAAAQLETPEGMKFSLILGDRDRADD